MSASQPTSPTPIVSKSAPDRFKEFRQARRSASLFNAMASDTLLRDQFITDPARIISEYFQVAADLDDDADATNQLVYALFSNAVTRNWFAREGARQNSLDGFAKSLTEAVARSGDSVATLALLRLGSAAKPDLAERLTVLRGIAAGLAGIISAGTEMSPGSGTEMSPGSGTEMSPGVGTEMSPGTIFAGTEMSSPGTEMSPGGGTEMSPGAIFSGTEMRSPGTEISPGPGTEVSPVGGFGGISVIFAALTNYAVQLRRAGALHVSGLELRG